MRRPLPATAALATSLAAALAPLAVPARAVDRIDVTDATVAAGDAPVPGVVTIDPFAFPGSAPILAAPSAPGAVGGMTGSLPSFTPPSGGIAPFLASSGTVTLPGGTYTFTSYTVASGATVRYSGPATIRTDGDVSIAGAVRTIFGGDALAFQAGGLFQLAGVAESAGALSVAAAEDVDLGFGSTATGDDVTFDAHGLVAGTGDLTLRTAEVTATGALTLRAARVASISDARAHAGGAVLVQSFGGAADVSGVPTTETRVRGGAGEVRIEAAGGVVVTDGARVETTGDAHVVLRATAGALLLDDAAAVVTATGDATLRASAGVTLAGGATVTSTSGAVELSAPGGDVALEPGGGAGTVSVASASGAVTLRASGGVVVEGDASVAAGGALRVDAAGGAISAEDDASLTGGSADLRASGSVVVAESARLTGGSVLVFAGDDADLAGAELAATAGELRCVARNDVRVRGAATATASLTLAALDADVDVEGADLRTTAATGDAASGDVVVETWSGPIGDIRAAGATIRSGDAESASGDVSLLIHGPSPDGPYLLPRRIVFRPGRGAPSPAAVTAAGAYETGGDDLDPSLPAKVSLGAVVIDLPVGLTRQGASRVWKFDDVGFTLRITTPPPGGRGTFQLQWIGDPAPLFGDDGSLALRYENASHALVCRVHLTRNRFRLGRDQRDLPEPRTWTLSVHGVLHEPGKRRRPAKAGGDQLRLALGFHSERRAPASAPDVRLTFGPAFAAVLPGGAARRTANRFTYRLEEEGARHELRLDWDRGIAEYGGRGIDLGGSFVRGADGVSALLRIGEEDHVVRFRVVRRGNSLRYREGVSE